MILRGIICITNQAQIFDRGESEIFELLTHTASRFSRWVLDPGREAVTGMEFRRSNQAWKLFSLSASLESSSGTGELFLLWLEADCKPCQTACALFVADLGIPRSASCLAFVSDARSPRLKASSVDISLAWRLGVNHGCCLGRPLLGGKKVHTLLRRSECTRLLFIHLILLSFSSNEVKLYSI